VFKAIGGKVSPASSAL